MKKVLESMKERLGVTWGELADYIGISRSMLDFLRKGERVPGNKTRRLVEEAAAKCEAEFPTNAPTSSHTKVGTRELLLCAVLALERIAAALEKKPSPP